MQAANPQAENKREHDMATAEGRGAVSSADNMGVDGQYVRIDFERKERCGFPEVVFCPRKSAQQVAEISARIFARERVVLATRADAEQAAAFLSALPQGHYEADCGVLWADEREGVVPRGRVLVLTAGTADLPVAREAALTARLAGSATELVADVGVAGLHRLLEQQAVIDTANVLVVVAGMEGALPSVVAGLTDKPIIAVPTSVGYGANLGGVTALLAMLNSCAGGVSVVNIDNGFGAAVIAHRINMLAVRQ
jgi:NCAIR mutase (PurE)-related protein